MKRKGKAKGVRLEQTKKSLRQHMLPKPKSWDVLSRKGVPANGVMERAGTPNNETSSQVFGAPAIAGCRLATGALYATARPAMVTDSPKDQSSTVAAAVKYSDFTFC